MAIDAKIANDAVKTNPSGATGPRVSGNARAEANLQFR